MAGKIPASDLSRVEDRCVREVVAMQEKVGLHSITDGEFRRESYISDFLNSIGVELRLKASTDLVYQDDQGNIEPGNKSFINEKIRWKQSPNVEAFRFLKSITRETPKVTIP